MPNRIIRESILTSRAVDKLTADEEVFYRRLMSVVDDYGRYHGDPRLLLAATFPLRVASITPAQVAEWLRGCQAAGLVEAYTVANRDYVCIVNFGQRLRRMKSKFPPPPTSDLPREADLPLERDVEDLVCDQLTAAGLDSVERQVRIGTGYADLVVSHGSERYVIEIKRSKLSPASLRQVARYSEQSGAQPVLIGAGQSASFDMNEARKIDCVVITYTEDFTFSALTGATSPIAQVLRNHVKSRDITSDHKSALRNRVKSCEVLRNHVKSHVTPESESEYESEYETHTLDRSVTVTPSGGTGQSSEVCVSQSHLERFERIYNRHAKKDGRIMAEQAWAERLSEFPDSQHSEVAARIDERHRAWVEHMSAEGIEPRYWPALHRWLREKRDLDKIPEPEDPFGRLYDESRE